MKKIFCYVFVCFLFFPNLLPAQNIVYTEFVPDGKIELKYPVVLVHGIARNDSGRGVHPWGRISRILRDNGVEVYYGNTDAWGDIKSNAELLKTTVDTILENTGHEKVNIIAHSKGGIDARYFIWKYGYGNRVASLTTVATPHGGSEMADFFFDLEVIQNDSLRRSLQTIGRLFGDVNPDMYSTNHDLTTRNMKEFNENITADPGVYYQSVYSVMNNSMDDPFFYRSHSYIKNISGNNDGLVSERSARWGNNIIKLPNSLSHQQIIDQGMRRIPGMDIPNIYLNLVRELGKKGF